MMLSSIKLRAAFTGAAAGTLVLVAGCMAAVGDPSDIDGELVDESREVEGTTQLIRDGIYTAGKTGVVEIGGCTGAMINARHIITAAHCVPELLGDVRSGQIERTIYYFDPDEPPPGRSHKRKITRLFETLDAFVKETYRGGTDTQSDLAVIRRRSSTPWDGTDESDYLRIAQGSCAQIDKNTVYGRGCQDHECNGTDVLYRMPIDIHWCGTHHFFDLEGSRALCRGDSGGPYILRVGNFDTVVGLVSGGQPDGDCTREGGKQRAVRMNADKLGWIESKMGFRCTVASNVDVPYVRCW